MQPRIGVSPPSRCREGCLEPDSMPMMPSTSSSSRLPDPARNRAIKYGPHCKCQRPASLREHLMLAACSDDLSSYLHAAYRPRVRKVCYTHTTDFKHPVYLYGEGCDCSSLLVGRLCIHNLRPESNLKSVCPQIRVVAPALSVVCRMKCTGLLSIVTLDDALVRCVPL